MDINWFPGHMTKSLRNMESAVKFADVIIYVLDARAPASCLNPAFEKLIGGKGVVYCLNKADTVERSDLKKWEEFFKGDNRAVLALDATATNSAASLAAAVKRLGESKLSAAAKKGIRATLRAMVMGVPNTGKSTIINNLCGAYKAKTGNRAGVTRGEQWVKIGNYFEVLDTPGTLYPKLDAHEVALHLAFIGSIRDEVLDRYELAREFIGEINRLYPGLAAARYATPNNNAETIIDTVARQRGFLLKGGEYDRQKAAIAVIDDFRKGKLGKLMLDRCGQ